MQSEDMSTTNCGDGSMADDRNRLLADFKRRKQGRTLSEAVRLLRLFGFVERKARKENSVWRLGSVTLTLPNTHGRFLKVPYVRLIIRKIEESEISAGKRGGQ